MTNEKDRPAPAQSEEQKAYNLWSITPWPDGSNAAREALAGAPAGARVEQAWREGFRAGLAAKETPVREELASPELNLRVDTTWATHDDLQTLRQLLEAAISQLRADMELTDRGLCNLQERLEPLEKMHEGQPENTTQWEKEIESRVSALEKLTGERRVVALDSGWLGHHRLIEDVKIRAEAQGNMLVSLSSDLARALGRITELERTQKNMALPALEAWQLHTSERISAIERADLPFKETNMEERLCRMEHKLAPFDLEKLTEDPGQFPDGTKYGALQRRVVELERSAINSWHEHQRLIEDAQKRADHHGMTLASHKSKLDNDYKAIEELRGRTAAAHGVLSNHGERLLRIETALGALGKLGT